MVAGVALKLFLGTVHFHSDHVDAMLSELFPMIKMANVSCRTNSHPPHQSNSFAACGLRLLRSALMNLSHVTGQTWWQRPSSEVRPDDIVTGQGSDLMGTFQVTVSTCRGRPWSCPPPRPCPARLSRLHIWTTARHLSHTPLTGRGHVTPPWRLCDGRVYPMTTLRLPRDDPAPVPWRPWRRVVTRRDAPYRPLLGVWERGADELVSVGDRTGR